MSLPVDYSQFAGLYESPSGNFYGMYYYKNPDLYEVWRHRDEKLMGVYSANTLKGACTSISLVVPKLVKIWEGVGLYRTYGPGWEQKLWKERPQRTSRPEPAPAPAPVLARITAAPAAQAAPAQTPQRSAAVLARQAAGQPVKANRRQLAISFN